MQMVLCVCCRASIQGWFEHPLYHLLWHILVKLIHNVHHLSIFLFILQLNTKRNLYIIWQKKCCALHVPNAYSTLWSTLLFYVQYSLQYSHPFISNTLNLLYTDPKVLYCNNLLQPTSASLHLIGHAGCECIQHLSVHWRLGCTPQAHVKAKWYSSVLAGRNHLHLEEFVVHPAVLVMASGLREMKNPLCLSQQMHWNNEDSVSAGPHAWSEASRSYQCCRRHIWSRWILRTIKVNIESESAP